MKKIIIYLSSQRSNSITLKICNHLINILDQKYPDTFICEIITPNTLNIDYCIGCQRCFKQCECERDFYDDCKILRNKFLSADLVVLATPVFARHVSTHMKIMIDRFAYWWHIKPLHNKIALTIVTSSHTGIDEASAYLDEVLHQWGCHVIHRIGYDQTNQKYIDFESVADDIYDYLINNKRIICHSFSNKLFLAYKSIYKEQIENGIMSAELKYWIENKYLNFNSYQELIDYYAKKV